MSDITAVVLSIGEESTGRALESIQKQVLRAKETITICNVTPFYKAMNAAAARVTTEFFVQVDSDMILDESCLQYLRSCVKDGVGIVMGHLRDPLMGRIGWIKLFRKKCFESVQYKDMISQDVVFREEISQLGWTTVYALRSMEGASRDLWHTFGEHRPAYTPLYTYSKYLVEGRRYRYRKATGALQWHFNKLKKNDHPAASIAQVALAHGIFIREETDLLKPYERNQDFEFIDRFLTATTPHRPVRVSMPACSLSPEKTFNKNYRLGVELGRAEAFLAFRHCMDRLGASRDPLAWVAKVGLCHGLFASEYSAKACAEEYQLLRELLAEYRPWFILKGKLTASLSATRRFILERRTIGQAQKLLDKFHLSQRYPAAHKTRR